jgi:hypothetical protein
MRIQRAIVLSIFVVVLSACALPPIVKNESQTLGNSPKVTFEWPTIGVQSTKYHLTRRFLNSTNYEFPVLIKEFHTQKITDGREGQDSIITLELWLLATDEIKERLWEISVEADSWQYFGWDEVVLIKYGCCDEPNEYRFYDFKTGSFLRRKDARELPAPADD